VATVPGGDDFSLGDDNLFSNRANPVNGSAKVAWDDTSLYVGFKVEDPDVLGGFPKDAKDPHLWAREMLVKQLSDQVTLPAAMQSAPVASNGAPANPFETAFQRGNLNPGGGGGGQQQQQLARVDMAMIDNPLVKIAGLILGSPEFQRQ